MTNLQLAGAMLWRHWPWRRASMVAGVVFAGWLALSLIAGGVEGVYVASAVSLALFVFFLIGPFHLLTARRDVTALSGDRAWALQHSWLIALLPALATVVSVFVVRRAFTLWDLDESLLGSAFDALTRGVILFVIAGLMGRVGRGSATRS